MKDFSEPRGCRSATRRWTPLLLTIAGLLSPMSNPTLGAELSRETTDLFSGAGNCAFCHDQAGRALLDRRGRDVSIVADWRATMMGNSSFDPFWRAVMEAEVEENPKLRPVVEEKCMTCHTPMARTQARHDGAGEVAFDAAAASPLAQEGVGCTLCHQIDPQNLGTRDSFTGHYVIPTNRVIFGPYEQPLAMPMRHHVDYTPTHGAHVQSSDLCGTCHTLFTPTLTAEGQAQGEFAEQTPYLEWRNSAYARRGKHCQDCHLPRLDEAIQISARPPWLGPRKPFWRHQFAGGNRFGLSLLADAVSDHAPEARANADPDQFGAMIEKTRAQLAQAVRLSGKTRRDGEWLELALDLSNETGHKFPTGHPYRRAWLHVLVTDRHGENVFESGRADAEGRLQGLDSPYPPHRDLITEPGQVQIYQATMADSQGSPTWSLLRAASLSKDNRLPPKGFAPRDPDAQHIRVCGGAETDPNFDLAAGRDTVRYRVRARRDRGPFKVEAELLYQPFAPEATDRLARSQGPAAKRFLALYRAADRSPDRVAALSLKSK